MNSLLRHRGQSAGLTRTRAFTGRPSRLPLVRREPAADGRLQLTVRLERPRWHQRLGAPARFDRTFRLDAPGIEVYDACDGKTDVEAIVRRFAQTHRIGMAEAELSVTAFLKTLIAKGLVAVAVKKDAQ